MPEDITEQILHQTAESIQKLCDLSTRIDERVKAIQINQKELESSFKVVQQKVAVLESKDFGDLRKELTQLEKRIIALESDSGQSKDRWNKIFTFVLQIIWVVLAAWLLMKLGLQAPP